MVKKPAFTTIPRKGRADPQFDAIAANLELLTGQKKGSTKRAVLVEELVGLGLAEFRGGKIFGTPGSKPDKGGTPPVKPPEIEDPTKPLEVKVDVGFQYASIYWQAPTYTGHAFAEIYYSTENNFQASSRIGVTPADIFGFAIPVNGKGYLWVRFVNQLGDSGPIHDANGIYFETQGNIDDLLDELTDKIDFDHLVPKLKTDIGKIPSLETDVDKIRDTDIPKLEKEVGEIPNIKDDIKNVADKIPPLESEISKIPGLETEVSKIPKIEVDLGDIRDTKIPEIEKETGKIPNIQDDIDEINDVKLPGLKAEVDKIPDIEKEIEDVNGDIGNLFDEADEQWKNSDKLAESILENALGSDRDRDSNQKRFATVINKQNVIVDDQKAMAEEIKVLTANFDDASADFVELTQVVAENDKATARQFTRLTSRVDGVEAGIQRDYYTKADTDSAIASATTALKSEIEDPEGNSIGADLYTNYYTKASTDEAISKASTKLRSEFEAGDATNKGEIDGVKDDLRDNYYTSAAIDQNYYTKADSDGALANVETKLRSEYKSGDKSNKDDIDGVSKDLADNYFTAAEIGTKFYTKAETEGAIAASMTTIKSEIENPDGTSIGADLKNNYYTKVDTDKAISQVETTLRAEYKAGDKTNSDNIKGVEDDLANNYYTSAQIDTNHYTKADADSAIASSTSKLKSEIEDPKGSSVGANLENNYYTKVDTDQAISAIETKLRSEYKAGDKTNADNITGVKDDLENNYYTSSTIDQNYYTSADVDKAISKVETTLRSEYQESDGVISDKVIDVENDLSNNYTTSADLNRNFYTKADADSAIATATTKLKSEIEDPDGASVGAKLANDYYTKTESDEAEAGIKTTLRSEYKKGDTDTANQVKADVDKKLADEYYTAAQIDQDFYTKTDTDSAIASATTALKSEIEDPDGTSIGATLKNNYYTKADTDGAIASSETKIRSEYQGGDKTNKDAIDGVEKDLNDNYFTSAQIKSDYYTSAEVDSAIGAITTTVSAEWRDESDQMSETDIENALKDDEDQDKQRQHYAEIVNKQYTFAGELESLAQQVTDISVEAKGNTAGVKEVKEAQADAEKATSRQLWQLRSNIDGVKANLEVNYYTKAAADEAISLATTKLKSEIEDPKGNSVGANLENNYYTKAGTDEAIAQVETRLSSEIDGVKDDLGNNYYTSSEIDQNYYTKAESDQAISQIETKLRSEYQAGDKTNKDSIDGVQKDLDDNYYTAADIRTNFYTKASVDEAISQVETTLRSEYVEGDKKNKDAIDGVSGDLANNYYTASQIDTKHYTKADTDSAIAQSMTTLKSQIEDPKGTSVGASLAQNYYTKTDTDSALSQLETSLRSEYKSGDKTNKDAIDGVNKDLKDNYYTASTIDTNYYTKAESDSAVAQLETKLRAEYVAGDATNKTEIDGVKGDLNDNYYTSASIDQNFYTKADVDESVSQLETKMRSEYVAGDKVNKDSIDGVNNDLKDNYYTSAQIDTNHYTKAKVDEAITGAVTTMKSEIEDPEGSSIGASLKNNYYTKVQNDSAMAAMENTLRSEYKGGDAKNKTEIDGINKNLTDNYYTAAEIDTNHYTKADADSAIAASSTKLKAEIEDPDGASVGAKLANDYYTKTESDKAEAGIKTTLRSEYKKGDTDTADAVKADVDKKLADDYYTAAQIDQDFYTKTDTDSAISSATTALKSEIEDPNGTSIGAVLNNNYYTKADTDGAIASSETKIRAEYKGGDKTNKDAIDGVEKDLKDNYYTSAQIQSDYYTSAEVDSAIGAITTTVAAEWRDESDNMAETDIENALEGDGTQDKQRRNYAEITNKQYAFAGELESLAQQVTEIEVEAKGNTAGIKEVKEAQADAEKATAKQFWQLRSNVDGVKADLDVNYYTKAESDSAISQATTKLKSEIEDPDGNSVGANLSQNYYTKAGTDGAISMATTNLKAEIEDPDGTSVGASLAQNYYTKTESDKAMSQLETTLRSEYVAGDKVNKDNIDGVQKDLDDNYYTSAEIRTNFYTKAAVDESMSQMETKLRSEYVEGDKTNKDSIDGVAGDLANNYYTAAEIDQNYYTKADSDSAIAQAMTTVKTEIEDPNGDSLGSEVSEVKKSVADVGGYQEALWGVKVKAGDVEASVGLVAKDDPSNPDIKDAYFVVQDADFRVVYTKDPDDPNNKEVAPIFGTVDNPNYDPDDPNSPKKILVIDTVRIKVASIKELTLSKIVADEIVSSSIIRSPKILSGEFNIDESGNRFSRFSVNAAGYMKCTEATIDGSLDVRSYIRAGGSGSSPSKRAFEVTSSGHLYADNGTFKGTIYADKIRGDVSRVHQVQLVWRVDGLSTSVYKEVLSFYTGDATSYNRVVSIPQLYCLNKGYLAMKAYVGSSMVRYSDAFLSAGTQKAMIGGLTFTIPKWTNNTKVSIRVGLSRDSGGYAQFAGANRSNNRPWVGIVVNKS